MTFAVSTSTAEVSVSSSSQGELHACRLTCRQLCCQAKAVVMAVKPATRTLSMHAVAMLCNMHSVKL